MAGQVLRWVDRWIGVALDRSDTASGDRYDEIDQELLRLIDAVRSIGNCFG